MTDYQRFQANLKAERQRKAKAKVNPSLLVENRTDLDTTISWADLTGDERRARLREGYELRKAELYGYYGF